MQINPKPLSLVGRSVDAGMREHDLSLEGLARRSKMSASYLNQLMRGRYRLTWRYALLIQNARIGINALELMQLQLEDEWERLQSGELVIKMFNRGKHSWDATRGMTQ